MRTSGAFAARLGVAGAVAIALSLGGCARPAANPPSSPVAPPDTPSPKPGQGDTEAALRAFAGLVAREDLAFHVDEAVESTGGGARATIDLDVAGSDFAAAVKADGIRRIELRHVGGTTFARLGDGRWRSGDPDEKVLDELADPFLYLCWLDDLEYQGPASDPEGGVDLACSRPYTYQTPLMRQFGKTGRVESMTLVLAADGAPVRMTFSGSGATLATEDETFSAEFAFSRVGEAIEVKAPRR